MANNNFLPLDLKESLFFETGYEIGEMVSISLDPDISIQTFSDYVSIRGVISLEGEYMKLTDWPEDDDAKKDETVEHIYRSVAKIAEDKEDQVRFYHHFPIEISVPFERISKIDDVTVSVEAFDYTLRHASEMKIAATLHINGIKQEQQPKEVEELKEPKVDVGDTFEFEIVKSKQETKQTEQTESKTLAIEQEEKTSEVEKQLSRTEETTEQDKLEEKDIEEEPVTNKERKQVQERQEDKSQVLKGENEQNDFKDRKEERLDKEEEEKIVEIKEEDDEREPIHIHEQVDLDEEESSTETLKDMFYLAEMFNDEDGGKIYQMKLRIVQEDESLIDIADAYEISTQKIINYNKLDDETITTGQLLLIPLAHEE